MTGCCWFSVLNPTEDVVRKRSIIGVKTHYYHIDLGKRQWVLTGQTPKIGGGWWVVARLNDSTSGISVKVSILSPKFHALSLHPRFIFSQTWPPLTSLPNLCNVCNHEHQNVPAMYIRLLTVHILLLWNESMVTEQEICTVPVGDYMEELVSILTRQVHSYIVLYTVVHLILPICEANQ